MQGTINACCWIFTARNARKCICEGKSEGVGHKWPKRPNNVSGLTNQLEFPN